MRSERIKNKQKVVMWLKRIFGIFVALNVGLVGMFILGGDKSLLVWRLMWYLPLFIGGIVAGYFSNTKGWLSGLIMALIWTGDFVFSEASGKAPAIHIFLYIMGLPIGAAGGYFGQQLAKKISIALHRKIIAVIVGIFIALILSIIIITIFSDTGKTYLYKGSLWWLKDITMNCIPILIGCIGVGMITQRHVWICAFLSWLVYETYSILIILCVGLGAPLLFALVKYEWSFVAETISLTISTAISAWWLYTSSLVSAIIGGYIGQFIAQKWQKRKLGVPVN